jgi:cytoskeletal protein RodZ
METNRFDISRELVLYRQKKPVSLREIADSTKISIGYLEAIESGDFQKLPPGIYATSYLRQYARAVAYDENTLVQCYRETVNPPQAEPGGPNRVAPSAAELWLRNCTSRT